MKKIVWLSFLLLFACSPKNEVGYKPYQETNSPKAKQVFDIPIQKSYWKNQDTLWVFFHLDPSFLLASKSDGVKVGLEYKIFAKRAFSQPQFTCDTTLTWNGEKMLGIKFPLTPFEGEPFYTIRLSDQIRNVFSYQEGFIQLEDQSPCVLTTEKGWSISSNSLSPNDVILCDEGIDSLVVKRYPIDCFALPNYREVMDVRSPKSDTTLILKTNESWSQLRSSSGFYFQVLSTDNKHAFGWSQCYSANPNNSIKYLLEDGEIKEVTKLDYEKFWFACAEGDAFKKERLIEEWEKRIRWVNAFYTSFQEGWKTHRGWVYLILGPPNRIELSLGAERWYYDFSPNENSVILFLSNPEGMHPNDYIIDWNNNLRYELDKGIRKWNRGAINTGY